MSQSLDRLLALVPPPATPIEAGNAAGFKQIEVDLGLSLPEDYKKLIHAYGTGQWQQLWFVLNPFANNRHLNLLVQSKTLRPKGWNILDGERMMRDSMDSEYPHPIYPELGGILPWAVTDNGGRFFWLTQGPPIEWPTIYYPDRSPDFEVSEMPCSAILYGAVSGELRIFHEELVGDFEYGKTDAFKALMS